MFEIMLDCFEEVSDDVCRDWEAAIDFFMHETDPRRFDFLLEDIFKKRSIVDATEHNLQRRVWYLETIADQMDWKARPFINQFSDQITQLKLQFWSEVLG